MGLSLVLSPSQGTDTKSTKNNSCSGGLEYVTEAARNTFFKYDTPRVVSVHSVTIGVINRVVQLTIIAYVLGFAMIWEKGYQETDTVESTVTTKVKGLILARKNSGGRSNFSQSNLAALWDTVDYVVPPLENGAFFVTTNVVNTPNQRQEVCPENFQSQLVEDGRCASDSDCPVDLVVENGNGIRTGVCNLTTLTCEILAWCPTEIDYLGRRPALTGGENLTVLVKNYIIFPKFNVRRRSIAESHTAEYLAKCRFHPLTDETCPIFRLGDIVTYSGENFKDISQLGAVLGILIDWNCDLDYDISLCRPKYDFRRIDDKMDQTAKGWNFRYADYWTDSFGMERRNLVKAYGIRFVFYVSGRAGKFAVVPFLTNIGAGLALLHVATFCCDFFLLHVVKFRRQFSREKYQTETLDQNASHVTLEAIRSASDGKDPNQTCS